MDWVRPPGCSCLNPSDLITETNLSRGQVLFLPPRPTHTHSPGEGQEIGGKLASWTQRAAVAVPSRLTAGWWLLFVADICQGQR